MNLDGVWVASRGKDSEKVIIDGNNITYSVFAKAKGENPNRTKSFTVKPANGIICGLDVYEIILEENISNGPDYYYHTETASGKEIGIISKTAFEYDGRGIIIIGEYVLKEDREFLGEDFKSELCRKLNDRQAPPMHMMNNNQPPAMGMMGKGPNMSMLNMNPEQQKEIPDGEEWTCECGHKNTGKFCSECGYKKPEQKSVKEEPEIFACVYAGPEYFKPEPVQMNPFVKTPVPVTEDQPDIPQKSEDNVTRFCKECGANAGSKKFCPECGMPIPQEEKIYPETALDEDPIDVYAGPEFFESEE